MKKDGFSSGRPVLVRFRRTRRKIRDFICARKSRKRGHIMKNALLEKYQASKLANSDKHPSFRAGDTVRVHYKVEEASKSSKDEKKFRIQVFEGVVLRTRGSGLDASFTVRKIGANSVGVERVFPMFSPYIETIELRSGGCVRRARLYYLRDLSGKAARIRTRRLPAGIETKTIKSEK